MGKPGFTMCLLVLLGLMATQANAMARNPMPLEDMDDPPRINEPTPLPISKGIENLALARADWKETTIAHVISLDIPGITKDAIKIEVEENTVLRISGERKGEDEAEGDKWHSTERTNRKFWGQFRLPDADLDHVKAYLGGGVLRITVPKFAEEKRRQPKVINIASEEGFCGEDL